MDALEFAKTRRRMCDYYHDYSNCNGCPLGNHECFLGSSHSDTRNDEIVIKNVERWGKDHPAKTRLSELLKICPNVKLDSDGAVNICPKGIDLDCHVECLAQSCHECKMKYWSEEVE